MEFAKSDNEIKIGCGNYSTIPHRGMGRENEMATEAHCAAWDISTNGWSKAESGICGFTR